jgi:CxxC motif-containing protein
VKQKTYIASLVVILAVIVLAVVRVNQTMNNIMKPETYQSAKAISTNNLPGCYGSVAKVSVSTATTIGDSVVNQLTNVPAGTNVTDKIATYDGNRASGSIIYPGNYGKYNFIVKKNTNTAYPYDPSDPYDQWVVVSFIECK